MHFVRQNIYYIIWTRFFLYRTLADPMYSCCCYCSREKIHQNPTELKNVLFIFHLCFVFWLWAVVLFWFNISFDIHKHTNTTVAAFLFFFFLFFLFSKFVSMESLVEMCVCFITVPVKCKHWLSCLNYIQFTPSIQHTIHFTNAFHTYIYIRWLLYPCVFMCVLVVVRHSL